VVYLNGRFVAASEARVSVFDRGFLYGDGVFETVRADHGRVFMAAAHFARLIRSATAIGLVVPLDGAGFAALLDRLLAENRLDSAILRCSVTRGVGSGRPDPTDAGPPTVVIAARPAPPRDPARWERGIAAWIVDGDAGPTATVKAMSYLRHILALGEAVRHGADEALLRTRDGRLVEGAVSNLFGVWSGRLMTPPDDGALLPGITRRVVLELAAEAGMPHAERPIGADDALHADELFITSAGREVTPVTQVNGAPVADGCPGSVTRRLWRAFQERVDGVQ